MPIGSQTNNSTPNASNSLFLINGTIWHEGTGTPDASIGTYPDFYIDTTSNNYYAKQCDGTWLLKGNFGTPLVCKTIVTNLVANTPVIISHANITNELCSYLIFDSINKDITNGLEKEIVGATLKITSNVSLNNIQVKLQGF